VIGTPAGLGQGVLNRWSLVAFDACITKQSCTLLSRDAFGLDGCTTVG